MRTSFKHMTRTFALGAISAGALLAAQAASAQAAQTPDPSATASGESVPAPAAQDDAATTGLGDIVVTAQRRAQNLQSVPIAVTAISGDNAIAKGITNTQDLTIISPGLMVQTQAASVQMYMRGVGTDASTAGTENAVATFVDGVYIPSMASLFFSLNNIERIEVLKGPQGTLYGRNATGGAINVVTKDPTSEPSATVNIGYGNLERVEANAYVSVGLAEGVALALTGLYVDQGKGRGINQVTGREVNKTHEAGLAAKLLLTPSDRLEIRLSGIYTDTDQDFGLVYRQADSGTVLVDGVPEFTGGFYDIRSDFQSGSHGKTHVAIGRIDYDLDFAKLVSISSYQKLSKDYMYDNDGSAIPFVNVNPFHQFGETYSQELQLQSDSSSKLSWIVGAYYFNDNSGYDPFRLDGPALAPLTFINRTVNQRTKSIAVFGQGTYEILPQTNLTIGARYTSDKRTLNVVDDSNFGVIFTEKGKAKASAPTWRVSLDHHFTDDVMLYASYSRGFKSGVFPTAAVATPSPAVDPEKIDAYELGLKSQFFDNRVRLNLDGFYYDYQKIQFSVYNGTANSLLNAAAAEIYGLDADMSVALSQSLTLSGSAEYLHTRYKDFFNAPISTPAPIGNILTPGDASGNQLIKAPKFVANAAIDYSVPLGDLGKLEANATFYHNSGFYWAPDNRVRQPSYNVVNATISWVDPSEHMRISLWAKNLFGEKYYTQLTEQNLGDTAVAGPWRLYGVRLGFTF